MRDAIALACKHMQRHFSVAELAAILMRAPRSGRAHFIHSPLTEGDDHMRLSPSLSVALSLAVALAACASIDTIETSMVGSDGITQATLVYVPDALMFRSRLTESMLARAGCTYVSGKQADIRKLREVLASSPVQAETVGSTMLEPRYALYLEKTNGAGSTLLFDRQYRPVQTRAGVLDGKPIIVDASLAAHLVQWAVDADIAQSNKACTYR